MTGAADAFRPFLWLAAIGFLVGFLSYLALGRPAAAAPEARTQAWDAASAPVSAEWNTPKYI
ncbi:hypothetical protein [Phenylobacterium sp.]|uniref:hypothetical protein n=1 Tax=Phenylobacterium sp. TaxID=1871053 RepID=UPI00391DC9BB